MLGDWVAHSVKAPHCGQWIGPMTYDQIQTVPVQTVAGRQLHLLVVWKPNIRYLSREVVREPIMKSLIRLKTCSSQQLREFCPLTALSTA